MRKTMADQVKKYRKDKGCTQQQLADAAGVSLSTVSRAEAGRSISILATMALSLVLKGAS
jgi:transcriptional regulator with XRE-family HTH domain